MNKIGIVDRAINDFATRCFRDTADGDYIAARMAFRARLTQQFLWPALQAIEKYLKCILLLNRVPQTKATHHLGTLLQTFDAAKKFEIRLSPRSREFISYLDIYGRHRYFESPYYVLGAEILSLDCAVWDIRRYAQSVDYVVTAPWGDIQNLPAALRAIEQAENRPRHKFSITGGVLESIMGERGNPAREPLTWQNAFFGTRQRKTIKLAGHMRTANSPLSMRPELVDEVLKYVFLPKDVRKAYREELARSRASSARNGAESGSVERRTSAKPRRKAGPGRANA